jgi:uncharacterized protein YuzE
MNLAYFGLEYDPESDRLYVNLGEKVREAVNVDAAKGIQARISIDTGGLVGLEILDPRTRFGTSSPALVERSVILGLLEGVGMQASRRFKDELGLR